MKQNNYTKLVGNFFLRIYDKNGPWPPRPQFLICPGSSTGILLFFGLPTRSSGSEVSKSNLSVGGGGATKNCKSCVLAMVAPQIAGRISENLWMNRQKKRIYGIRESCWSVLSDNFKRWMRKTLCSYRFPTIGSDCWMYRKICSGSAKCWTPSFVQPR